MNFDDPVNTRSSAAAAQSVALRHLFAHIQSSIAPVALEINAPHLVTWAREQALERFRHQYLINEIKIWAQHLQRRPVNHIRFIEPFAIVDAAGLTEIAFALGHNLRLLQGRNKEQAATLRMADVTRENVALLKGLGFNHIFLRLEGVETTQEVAATVLNIQEFNFPRVSLQLAQTPRFGNPLSVVMELLLTAGPESVSFALPASHIFDSPLDTLTSSFMQLGYSLRNDHLLTRFNTRNTQHPSDHISLGPGSHSHIGPVFFNNHNEPQAYLALLTKSELPLEAMP